MTVNRIKREKIAGIYEMFPAPDGEYVRYSYHAALCKAVAATPKLLLKDDDG